ncbi:hypothetical protein [Galbibacter sp. BG1]
MAKYRKKPVEIEAITFDELVEYGKEHSDNLVNGMPWSFDFNGHPVTHENDECYIVPTNHGSAFFKRGDMLIIQIDGEIYPCKKEVFDETYEKVVPTWVLDRDIKRLQDGDGHWYWIPLNEVDSFAADLDKIDGKDYMDCPDEYDAFSEKYEKYRTGGSPDLIPDFFNEN